MQLLKKQVRGKFLCAVMLPESDQCRTVRTALAGIPSKNWAFTLKTGNNCLFLSSKPVFFPASIQLVERIYRSRLYDKSVGFGY